MLRGGYRTPPMLIGDGPLLPYGPTRPGYRKPGRGHLQRVSADGEKETGCFRASKPPRVCFGNRQHYQQRRSSVRYHLGLDVYRQRYHSRRWLLTTTATSHSQCTGHITGSFQYADHEPSGLCQIRLALLTWEHTLI